MLIQGHCFLNLQVLQVVELEPNGTITKPMTIKSINNINTIQLNEYNSRNIPIPDGTNQSGNNTPILRLNLFLNSRGGLRSVMYLVTKP